MTKKLVIISLTCVNTATSGGDDMNVRVHHQHVPFDAKLSDDRPHEYQFSKGQTSNALENSFDFDTNGMATISFYEDNDYANSVNASESQSAVNKPIDKPVPIKNGGLYMIVYKIIDT